MTLINEHRTSFNDNDDFSLSSTHQQNSMLAGMITNSVCLNAQHAMLNTPMNIDVSVLNHK